MGEKIAVAIVHGIGKTRKDFSEGMQSRLLDRIRAEAGPQAAEDIVMHPVHWGDIIEKRETDLKYRVGLQSLSAFGPLREFLISFAGDAIAYQRRPEDQWVYDLVHAVFARTLKALAAEAGPRAPLCVVSHSLGTIIASNYLYDLQKESARATAFAAGSVKTSLPAKVRAAMNPAPTPLERGDTLSHMFTLGSPLAVWSLSYECYGRPLTVPAPSLATHHPNLKDSCGWTNLYDKQDVLAYPLKGLSKEYEVAVKRDIELDVGVVPINMTPISHTKYWEDANVINEIATGLSGAWTQLNSKVVVRT